MLSRTELNVIATKLGVEFLGVVPLEQSAEDIARFESWLAEGKHAGMSFLERNLEVRKDPRTLLPGAKNAIILAINYHQGDRMNEFRQRSKPWIAQYARNRDYHKSLRAKGEAFVEALKIRAPSAQARVCVDSAPLLERALAAKTALGFIGKNSLFIHPKKGSFLLLFEILTDVELPLDTPASNFKASERSADVGGCGTCQRCKINCPTNALSEDFSVDARLCISYWTIEHRGVVPHEMWPVMEDYIFGCDLCQIVCPYNRDVLMQKEAPRLEREYDLAFLAGLSQEDYVATFGGSPVTRTKREGLRRNALIAMAVTKDSRLRSVWEALSDDPDPTLRATCEQIVSYGYLNV